MAFDKERFHNQLALRLGYERIINDKRINISINDGNTSERPQVVLDALDGKFRLNYNASLTPEDVIRDIIPERMKTLMAAGVDNEIKELIEAIHLVYIQVSNNYF